jgi:hypothetical protein
MINAKLQNLYNIKNDIGTAIVNKGGTITESTPFYSYAGQIDSISTGTPQTVFQDSTGAKWALTNVVNLTNVSNNVTSDFNWWQPANNTTSDSIMTVGTVNGNISGNIRIVQVNQVNVAQYQNTAIKDIGGNTYTGYNGYDAITNNNPTGNIIFNRWILNNTSTANILTNNSILTNLGFFNGPNIVGTEGGIEFNHSPTNYSGGYLIYNSYYFQQTFGMNNYGIFSWGAASAQSSDWSGFVTNLAWRNSATGSIIFTSNYQTDISASGVFQELDNNELFIQTSRYFSNGLGNSSISQIRRWSNTGMSTSVEWGSFTGGNSGIVSTVTNDGRVVMFGNSSWTTRVYAQNISSTISFTSPTNSLLLYPAVSSSNSLFLYGAFKNQISSWFSGSSSVYKGFVKRNINVANTTNIAVNTSIPYPSSSSPQFFNNFIYLMNGITLYQYHENNLVLSAQTSITEGNVDFFNAKFHNNKLYFRITNGTQNTGYFRILNASTLSFISDSTAFNVSTASGMIIYPKYSKVIRTLQSGGSNSSIAGNWMKYEAYNLTSSQNEKINIFSITKVKE